MYTICLWAIWKVFEFEDPFHVDMWFWVRAPQYHSSGMFWAMGMVFGMHQGMIYGTPSFVWNTIFRMEHHLTYVPPGAPPRGAPLRGERSSQRGSQSCDKYTLKYIYILLSYYFSQGYGYGFHPHSLHNTFTFYKVMVTLFSPKHTTFPRLW